jgi:hypothetical protein
VSVLPSRADGIIGVGLKIADCDEKGLWQERCVQRRGKMEGRATRATHDDHPIGTRAVLAYNPLRELGGADVARLIERDALKDSLSGEAAASGSDRQARHEIAPAAESRLPLTGLGGPCRAESGQARAPC